MVVKIRDKKLDYYRALKIPRPRDPELIDTARSEIDYLRQVRHENVIALYYVGEVMSSDDQCKYPFFIMDFIEGAKDLRKFITENLSKCESNQHNLSEQITKVVEIFLNISNAILFLHNKGILHFDIKPSNILIANNDKPLLSDLGFARMKSESATPASVGFSFPYAHPDLITGYDQKYSENRVRTRMAPKDFDNIFDIYAFGKTILETLYYFENKFSDLVVYNYCIVYLHLAACRMLDGKNMSEERFKHAKTFLLEKKIEPKIYKEEWIGLQSTSFKEIKYQSFLEIYNDLKKLIFGKHFWSPLQS